MSEMKQTEALRLVDLLVSRNNSPTGFGLGPVCDDAAAELRRLDAVEKQRNQLQQAAQQALMWIATKPENRLISAGRMAGILVLALEAKQQAEPVAIPDECPHIIWFDDSDMRPMMFAGSGARDAALKAFERVSMQWNAHLFVRIQKNSRDDRYPCAPLYANPQSAHPEQRPSTCTRSHHHEDMSRECELRTEIARLTSELERVKAEQQVSNPVESHQIEPVGMVLVPKRMNAAMRRVTDEEGWAWEDLLAAAEAITEDDHADLGRSQQHAEPVAWRAYSDKWGETYWDQRSDAILHDAEENPDPLYLRPQPTQQTEPVAEVIESHVRPSLNGMCTAVIESRERMSVGAELFLHPQPAQQPTHWISDTSVCGSPHTVSNEMYQRGRKAGAYEGYTRVFADLQPVQQPLTDKQILEKVSCTTPAERSMFLRFARAIEREIKGVA